jgi:hypothetical protein
VVLMSSATAGCTDSAMIAKRETKRDRMEHLLLALNSTNRLTQLMWKYSKPRCI